MNVRQSLATPRWILLLTSLLIAPITQAAQGIEINRASLIKSETAGVYLLNAGIDYQFSEAAQEALHNGVALTMTVTLKIFHPRNWLWDQVAQRTRLTYQLRYRTLTRIYQVIDLNSGKEANYSSLGTASRALGHLENVVIATDQISGDLQPYSASIKAILNIEALPLPMRPLAYITPAWHHSSDWYTWPLHP